MYSLMKKNQKKLMAVFAVLLMISFVATIGVGRFGGGGGGRSTAVVGNMGKTPVYSADMEQARDQWAWLSRWSSRDMLGRRLPLPARLIANGVAGSGGPAQFMEEFHNEQIGTEAAAQIDRHPELFYLLVQEAMADGVSVPIDDARAYLKNYMGMDMTGENADSMPVQAVQNAMLIGAQLGRLKNAAKVSQPVWQHDAAKEQSVRLSLIDFRAADYEKSVPHPTPQQLQAQFDRFKDIPPGTTSSSNPLGFGYQIPARVRLQYLTIPRAAVVDAVLRNVHPTGAGDLGGSSSGDAMYDWEVQAALYYDAHKEEFKNPPPSTQPSTEPAATKAAATTRAAAAIGPQLPYKPFPEVKQQILEKLSGPEVDKLARRVADELQTRLSKDLATIAAADPAAVLPTTMPSTPAGAQRPTSDLMMLSHLEQIRAEIQQKEHVAIELHEVVKDWQTREDLAKLPGIGDAKSADGVAFPIYATSFAGVGNAPPLHVWQPSSPLTDDHQNTYLFRLTEAQPPHAPASIAMVGPQVEQDWRLAQAYDMAMQSAQKALASAKTSGLAQAARTAAQNIVDTPLFSPQRAQDVPSYGNIPAGAAREVLTAAASLVSQATPADKHPVMLVALPGAQRVVVMELAGIELPVPEWVAQVQVTDNAQMTAVQQLAGDWFDYDHVLARTGYKPVEKSS